MRKIVTIQCRLIFKPNRSLGYASHFTIVVVDVNSYFYLTFSFSRNLSLALIIDIAYYKLINLYVHFNYRVWLFVYHLQLKF